MVEIVKLGSLYFDDKPVGCGTGYNGQKLEIKNTVPGEEISWVKVNNLFVSNRTICTKISWTQLDQLGFIFGKLIWIDNALYLCRSLKVCDGEGVPTEWNNILDATNEDDELWHWKATFFWGQETVNTQPSHRVLCGRYSARSRSHDAMAAFYSDAGFRPVLEPMIPQSMVSDTLIGKHIEVYGPTGSIKGTLQMYSAYDLFLGSASCAASVLDRSWCRRQTGAVIVDRSAVSAIREA